MNKIPKEYKDIKRVILESIDKVVTHSEAEAKGVAEYKKLLEGVFGALDSFQEVSVTENSYANYVKESIVSVVATLLYTSVASPLLFGMCEQGIHSLIQNYFGDNSVQNLNKVKMH